MADIELASRFLEEALEMRERGHLDASAVLTALAGAYLEGPHVVSALATHNTDFCIMREVVRTLPVRLHAGLLLNAERH